MNYLYGNIQGNYRVSQEDEMIQGYQYVGAFQTIKEKLELIEYYEAMYLDEIYWTDFQIEEEEYDE